MENGHAINGWLVVWNSFYFSIYIYIYIVGIISIPTDFLFFQRGSNMFKPPTSHCITILVKLHFSRRSPRLQGPSLTVARCTGAKVQEKLQEQLVMLKNHLGGEAPAGDPFGTAMELREFPSLEIGGTL